MLIATATATAIDATTATAALVAAFEPTCKTRSFTLRPSPAVLRKEPDAGTISVLLLWNIIQALLASSLILQLFVVWPRPMSLIF